MPSKKETRKERAKRSRDTLSDSYVISLLLKELDEIVNPWERELKASDLRKHPEFIDCKRTQIKLERLLRKQKNEEKI